MADKLILVENKNLKNYDYHSLIGKNGWNWKKGETISFDEFKHKKSREVPRSWLF